MHQPLLIIIIIQKPQNNNDILLVYQIGGLFRTVRETRPCGCRAFLDAAIQGKTGVHIEWRRSLWAGKSIAGVATIAKQLELQTQERNIRTTKKAID